MTSGQEMEHVYSYNPGAHMGLLMLQNFYYKLKLGNTSLHAEYGSDFT